MFHEIEKSNNDQLDARDVEIKEIYKKHIEEVTSSYCPIIFVDDKEIVDWKDSNTIEAECLMSMNNIHTAYNNNLKDFPYPYLYSLEDSNILTIKIIIDRIKEESIMNIMSFMDNIDSITNNMFLRFFNLREAIESEIRNHNSIDDIVFNFYNSNPFSLDKFTEKEVNETKNMTEIYSRNILAALIYKVNYAINKSIDDTIFRIHLIPNIMELKDLIIKNYKVPKEDQNDRKFWIFANISIKQGLSFSFNEVLYPVIFNNIKSILETSVGTSYYIYNDAITEKNKEERAKREAEKKQKGSTDDFIF